jgi:hypothetical protein
MREKFGAVRGCNVEVLVTGFLWSETIAALAVEIAEKSSDGKAIPRPENSFSHATIWFAEGERASNANNLPRLVNSGKAKRIDFVAPIVLKGIISFWDNENKPIPL